MTTLQGSRARERGKCECWHHRLEVVKIVTLSIALSKRVRGKLITLDRTFSLIADPKQISCVTDRRSLRVICKLDYDSLVPDLSVHGKKNVP